MFWYVPDKNKAQFQKLDNYNKRSEKKISVVKVVSTKKNFFDMKNKYSEWKILQNS